MAVSDFPCFHFFIPSFNDLNQFWGVKSVWSFSHADWSCGLLGRWTQCRVRGQRVSTFVMSQGSTRLLMLAFLLGLCNMNPPTRFSSMPCTLETHGSVRFTLQEWEWYPLPWGWSSYTNNSEFFCMKSLSLYLYLLIYSITYLYQYVSWMFILYLLSYNSKLLYVFWLFQF